MKHHEECPGSYHCACSIIEARDLYKTVLAQTAPYIAHDTIAHAVKKVGEEYEIRFDPGCRRCLIDNVLTLAPKPYTAMDPDLDEQA